MPQRDPDAYRNYQREYQRKRRAAAGITPVGVVIQRSEWSKPHIEEFERVGPFDPDIHPSVLYPNFGDRYADEFAACPRPRSYVGSIS